ncbi:MAG: corrinoid protein [Deltaproteobacteria bacterium]|jgi:trimethylamine corrinoid protein|nr:corrinoid protein [Deltaproteobacteria bacterium]MBW2480391.1 corrinoid protein [Deltaproteobacteria bacterium]
MTQKIFEEAIKAIVDGDTDRATELARRGLDEGIAPLDLMNSGFIPGINQVGDLFGSGKLFIPGLIKSANAMEKATAVINDAIPREQETVSGKIVIGTVEGDMHDIGKTIVVSLMRANGFEVLDLGRDVPTDRFIEAAEKFNADIIGSSTLLTTTMPMQKELEEELKKAGLKDKYKTIVGGAPVTQRWADRIGADAFAQDAGDGVKKVKQLLAEQR